MDPTDARTWRAPVVAAVLVAASALCVLWLVAAPMSAVVTVDGAVVEAVAQTRPAWLVAVGVALGTVGTPAVPIALTVAVGAATSWRRRAAGPLLLAVGGVCALVLGDRGLKTLVDRARPPQVLWAMPAQGASFPSGHAVFSLGAFLLIVAILARRGTWPHPALVALCGGLAAAVGVSRVVVGVHYPSDVLAGWAVAIIATGLALLLVAGRPSDRRSHGTNMDASLP